MDESREDQLIDTIRRLESEKYSCRDREGRLKVGTGITRPGFEDEVKGIIVHVGDISTSPSGRQAYYATFFHLNGNGRVSNPVSYWVDETQFTVPDEQA